MNSVLDKVRGQMEQARSELQQARQEAVERKRAADEELAKIDQAIKSINSALGVPTAARTQRRTSGRRGQFGSRDRILDEVKKHPEGVTMADVRSALELDKFTDEHEQKRANQFVSNALSHFRRQGQVTLKDGKYMLVA